MNLSNHMLAEFIRHLGARCGFLQIFLFIDCFMCPAGFLRWANHKQGVHLVLSGN